MKATPDMAHTVQFLWLPLTATCEVARVPSPVGKRHKILRQCAAGRVDARFEEISLKIIKQAHVLRFGEGLLRRLQREHLDIQPADGLGVI